VYERFSNDIVSVGVIDLGDLSAISRLNGRDGLPYPFAHAHPHKQSEKLSAAGVDRLDREDLSEFRGWMDAYIAVDIWVACRVHHRNSDTPGRRILAYYAGQTGYIAAQRINEDVVEVSELSAVDLGAVIAGSVGLIRPGRMQPGIVIPGYVGYFAHEATPDDDEVYAVCVGDRSSQHEHPVLTDEDVAAIALIQSRWQPARKWGVDRTKTVVACRPTPTATTSIHRTSAARFRCPKNLSANGSTHSSPKTPKLRPEHLVTGFRCPDRSLDAYLSDVRSRRQGARQALWRLPATGCPCSGSA
jgi:hypothetical protein